MSTPRSTVPPALSSAYDVRARNSGYSTRSHRPPKGRCRAPAGARVRDGAACLTHKARAALKSCGALSSCGALEDDDGNLARRLLLVVGEGRVIEFVCLPDGCPLGVVGDVGHHGDRLGAHFDHRLGMG